MAEWYYTDQWGRQYGPVDDSGILELNDNRVINANTAVWRKNMQRWEPFRTVAADLFESNEDGTPADLAVCAHSAMIQPRGEMIPYGDALIAVDAKKEFVQSLMETGRTMVTDATESGTRYRGFWWRFLGILLDETVKYAVMAVLSIALFAVFFGVTTYFGVSTEDEALAGILLAGLIFIAYASGALYEILMVGKYQGTLGKMVIGAKIVQPDDSRVSYKRSLGRWLAKVPIFVEGVKILPYLMFVFFIGMVSSGLQSDNSAFIIASWFLAFTLPAILTIVLSSVFWMAAFDSEKRALHDRIASTRVVPK